MTDRDKSRDKELLAMPIGDSGKTMDDLINEMLRIQDDAMVKASIPGNAFIRQEGVDTIVDSLMDSVVDSDDK